MMIGYMYGVGVASCRWTMQGGEGHVLSGAGCSVFYIVQYMCRLGWSGGGGVYNVCTSWRCMYWYTNIT